MADDQLGPLLRLWGLATAQLPDPAETPDNLAPFLISILQEAVPFVDSVAPKTAAPAANGNADNADPFVGATSPPTAAPSGPAWKSKGSKSYPESAAKVHLSERIVSAADLERIAGRAAPPALGNSSNGATGKPTAPPAETWVSRRSVHADSAEAGARTASWDEFRRAMRDTHAESEEAFTPSVTGARAAIVWDCGAVEAVEGGETWGAFALRVEEVRHRIGRPVVKDRVFPVLQMTCSAMRHDENGRENSAAVSRTEKPEFLVVSIAVADFGRAAEQAEFSREKGVVVGAYTSVERIRKLPGGDIEWIMATASDARGALPAWMQTMAVPGQIAKDVPLFLSWVARGRGGDKEEKKEEKKEKKKDERKKKESNAATSTPAAEQDSSGAPDGPAPKEPEPTDAATDSAPEASGQDKPADGKSEPETAASDPPPPTQEAAKEGSS